MKKLFSFSLITFLIITNLMAQGQKKNLDHDAIEKWNNITQTVISDNGSYVSYKVEPWKGDSEIFLYSNKGALLNSFMCATDIRFTGDSRFLLFKRVPSLETVRTLKMKKTKKDDMPGDKLGIYDIKAEHLMEFEDLLNFLSPDKWSGFMAYQVKPALQKTKESEEGNKEEVEKEKVKEESGKNGHTLNLRDTESGETITWPFVKTYQFCKEKKELVFVTTGDDKEFVAGLYSYNIESGNLVAILKSKADFKSLHMMKDGSRGAFLLKEDEESDIYNVYSWTANNTASLIIDNDNIDLREGWQISANERLEFSNNGARLFFGTAPVVPEIDSLRLDDEYPNVDIWHGTEGKLHTVQVLDKNKDLKKAYKASFNIASGKITQLETEAIPDVTTIDRGDNKYVLGVTNVPYQLQTMWEGSPNHVDVYLINVEDGTKTLIKKDIRARVQPSPDGKYLAWYNYPDASYYSYNIADKKEYRLSDPSKVVVANELNDVPNLAGPYGQTGWIADNGGLLINDRYDIWKFDLDNRTAPKNMTGNGREKRISYRYVKFDWEERFIDISKPLFLSGQDEVSRESFYFNWDASKAAEPKMITGGKYALSRPQKAKDAKTVVFTKSTFNIFPDLLVSDLNFKKAIKISDANPQQSNYKWGTAELVKWISLDGLEVEGMLFKPENFDPQKKYPMIVNFYEKSSQGIFNHRTPQLHRSTIDYHYYTSNGYVIFNPDVYYEDGYPGESAFNCVMPGITAIINMGFVDKDRIGAQGHSWGGYQVAYLATRTDLFAAIESGAPVVNMFSAYGGIRWGSGLNRSFQYEHTQSRIGATIWEAPLRYLENSPLFTMDKVTTPILILHNDNDGAVPWYQGIEYYVALRRLQKPVWMLNYNGEPHWPQKFENKKDFQIRMSQFFNHYLKGMGMPVWMKDGIPVIQKEHDLGYELIKE